MDTEIAGHGDIKLRVLVVGDTMALCCHLDKNKSRYKSRYFSVHLEFWLE